jgi:hypothetical protein
MPKEIQRFYRAVVFKDGAPHTISFRADNIGDAESHAKHCCRMDGYTFGNVHYIGVQEPRTSDFGSYVKGR